MFGVDWPHWIILFVIMAVLFYIEKTRSQIWDMRRQLELSIARGPDPEKAKRLAELIAREEAEEKKRQERRKFWWRVAGYTFAAIVGMFILFLITPNR